MTAGALTEFCPETLWQRLPQPAPARYWVAYSGGRDSHVLLHAMAALRDRLGAELCAIHVDHGLQPASADWAEHCQAVCADLGVALVSRRLQLGDDLVGGVEAAAREARYRAFESVLGPGDCLLTAHHRDDQAETVLLRLLRGAGVEGLAAMPAQRPLGAATLFRPLLAFSRAQLADYARQHSLSWVEDPSNAQIHAARNFVRQRALPMLSERWAGLDAVLVRTSGHMAEASQLLGDLARLDWEHCAEGGRLQVPALQRLSPARRRNLLRCWLRSQVVELPGTARLEAGLDAILRAGEDRAPLLEWPAGAVRRYRDELYFTPPLAPVPDDEWHWDLAQPLRIPGLGILRAVASVGGIDPARLDGGVTIRFRRGGERCKLPGRPGKSLKHLLQEAGVPPWERERLPLLVTEDRLVAVADRWVCDGYQAAPGRHGITLQWLSEGSGGPDVAGAAPSAASFSQ